MLFITSTAEMGADTWVQLLVLRSLAQDRFELHAAVQPSGSEAGPDRMVARIPGLRLRSTNFGPSFFQQSRRQKLLSAARLVPASLSLLGLARYIRQQRIQVLHATDRPRDAIACATLSALTGAKSVIHVHVKYGDWMSRGVKWALGRADAVVGVSKFVAQSLLDAGYASSRVRTVLNAIDPSSWNPTLEPTLGRAALGMTSGMPLILCVARIFSDKGQADLIRALPMIARRYPEVRLVIVGTDYPEGSGATAELKLLADSLGVRDNVIFTGQRRDVPLLMAACDVFCLPSFEEPFGLVYAEAMAMKRPVVALASGGVPEVVSHEQTGLLAAPGDIDSLAAHVLTLLGEPALRARLGELGRKQVEAHFHPSRIASDFGSLYTELCGSPRATRSGPPRGFASAPQEPSQQGQKGL